MKAHLNTAAAQALFWLAQGLLAGGSWGRWLARSVLQTAALLNPRDLRTQGWLRYLAATAASRRGRIGEALELLREAVRLVPNSPAIEINLGMALMMDGQFEQAISVLERVMRNHADLELEPPVWQALAWSYLRTGRNAKVPEIEGLAQEGGASSPELQLLVLLADGAQRGRVNPEAVRRLVVRRPRTLGIVLEFSEQQALRGQRRLARSLLRGLPEELQARGMGVIAQSALNAAAYETALWAVGEYENLSPQASAVATLRSEIALRRGESDRAVREAERATRLEPKEGRAWEQLGRALLLAGQTESAARAFVECLATGSPSALAGGVVAMALLRRGDVKQAQLVYAMARNGEALGCAYSHAAQALMVARLGQDTEVVRVAALAQESVGELRAWERKPEVLAQIGAMLGEALTQVAQSQSASAEEAARLLASITAPTLPPSS